MFAKPKIFCKKKKWPLITTRTAILTQKEEATWVFFWSLLKANDKKNECLFLFLSDNGRSSSFCHFFFLKKILLCKHESYFTYSKCPFSIQFGVFGFFLFPSFLSLFIYEIWLRIKESWIHPQSLLINITFSLWIHRGQVASMIAFGLRGPVFDPSGWQSFFQLNI